jgi:hypothetical protein
VRRHALELSANQFDYDVARLLKVLDKTLAEVRAQPAVKESEVSTLALWTEHDSKAPRRDVSRDLICHS